VETEHQRSAGGLVVRPGEGGDPEAVLLISVHGGRRWQLPKGHVEADETPEQTAVRETREETGVTGRPLAPLPPIEYWFHLHGRRVHKRVDYLLLVYVEGSTDDFDRDEVSGAEWFGWDEALGRLTYANERQVAEAARRAWADLRPGEAEAAG